MYSLRCAQPAASYRADIWHRCPCVSVASPPPPDPRDRSTLRPSTAMQVPRPRPAYAPPSRLWRRERRTDRWDTSSHGFFLDGVCGGGVRLGVGVGQLATAWVVALPDTPCPPAFCFNCIDVSRASMAQGVQVVFPRIRFRVCRL